MDKKNSLNTKHYTFMNKKQLYTTPEVDVLVLQTEGVVCQSAVDSEGSFGIDGFLDDGLELII